ncbi:MAG: YopX family protein [Candidatus Thorarchaeota archaeon]
MREFKFRGKGKNREWVYGHFVELIEDYDNEKLVTTSYIVSAGKNIEYREVDRETVGQYTGLKDMNGKEIYEGDILQLNGDENARWVVEWDACKFVFRPIYPGLKYLKPDDWCDVLEIVGNIYDNPELLERS